MDTNKNGRGKVDSLEEIGVAQNIWSMEKKGDLWIRKINQDRIFTAH